MSLKKYIDAFRLTGITPPFQLSLAYLNFIGAQTEQMGNTLLVLDNTKTELLFPPLLLTDYSFLPLNMVPYGHIRHLPMDCSGGEDLTCMADDVEYIYSPHDAKARGEMRGYPRQCVRKVRKQFSEVQTHIGTMPIERGEARRSRIMGLLNSWLAGFKAGASICSDGTIISMSLCVAEDKGNENLGYMAIMSHSRLLSLAIWDLNWSHLNLRHMFYDRTIQSISAFTLVSILKMKWLITRNLKVNAGGHYHNPGLAQWKEQMHPENHMPIMSARVESKNE